MYAHMNKQIKKEKKRNFLVLGFLEAKSESSDVRGLLSEEGCS
jgi:hypothetical protein